MFIDYPTNNHIQKVVEQSVDKLIGKPSGELHDCPLSPTVRRLPKAKKLGIVS